jgi:hypothetical protein
MIITQANEGTQLMQTYFDDSSISLPEIHARVE